MRWILLATLVVGCGSSAAGERLTPDADSTQDAAVDTGTVAAGGAAGASSIGGASGAGGAVVAPSCAIAETSITVTAGDTQIVPQGSKCSVPSFQGPFYPEITNGQVVAGVPYAGSDKWSLANYVIVPSGKQCAATVEFTCAGCAGNCDAFMQINLTVAPQ